MTVQPQAGEDVWIGDALLDRRALLSSCLAPLRFADDTIGEGLAAPAPVATIYSP
jgi:hypothetical protein